MKFIDGLRNVVAGERQKIRGLDMDFTCQVSHRSGRDSLWRMAGTMGWMALPPHHEFIEKIKQFAVGRRQQGISGDSGLGEDGAHL